MKKTPFLAHILAALFAGIAFTSCEDQWLRDGQTGDLEGQTYSGKLRVAGTGNTLKNGTFTGALTLEADSQLIADSVMTSDEGPTSITLKNGSRLDMVTGYDEERGVWRNNSINDISVITVDGVATIKDAYLRVKTSTEYTLGNGVENLVGEGITSIVLQSNSTLNLGKKVSNLNIKAGISDNWIKEGTVNTRVEIESGGWLWLSNVTIGNNASFIMGDSAKLDLGGEEAKLAGFTVVESATARVDNGTLWVGSGDEVAMNPNLSGDFILDLRGGTLNLNNSKLAKDAIVTGDAVISGGTIGSGVYIDFSRNLTLDGVAVEKMGASFTMGNDARLNLGGAQVLLNRIKCEGITATVANGKLIVESWETLKLDVTTLNADTSDLELQGGKLDLNGVTLISKSTSVTGDATIGGGTLEGNLTVGARKKLTLSGKLEGQGGVMLGNEATLDMGGKELAKDVTLEGAATLGNGVLNGSLAVMAEQTLSLLANTTVTDITLGGGSTLSFNLSDDNLATPTLTVGGSMQLNGGETASTTINLASAGELRGREAYALISMTDGKTPDSWNSGKVGVTGLTTDPSLLFWNCGTLYYSAAPAPETLTWTGINSGMWGGLDKNWMQGFDESFYRDGVKVEFRGGASRPLVQLAGVLAPESVLVSADSDYTFTGGGKLTGAMQLTKEGGGTLTIGTANEYTGGTVIRGGKLVLEKGATLGTGAVTLEGGTLDFGTNALANTVTVKGSAELGNGMIAGSLTVEEKQMLTLLSGTTVAGSTNLHEGAALNLGGSRLDGDVTLEGNAMLGNGALNGALSVGNDKVLTICCGNLTGTGNISLGNNAVLNLDSHGLGNNVTLTNDAATATIRNGIISGTVTVGADKTLIISGVSDMSSSNGRVGLNSGATLKVGGGSASAVAQVYATSAIGAPARLVLGQDLDITDSLTLDCGVLDIQSADGAGIKSINADKLSFSANGAALILQGASLTVAKRSAPDAAGTVNVGESGTLTLENGAGWDGTDKYVDLKIGTGGTVYMGGGAGSTLHGVEMEAGGKLVLGQDSIVFMGGDITGEGSVYLVNEAALDLGGTHSLSGSVDLAEGAGSALGNGSLAASATVNVDKMGTLVLRGDLSGEGQVVLGADATLDLNYHSLSAGVVIASNANSVKIGTGKLESDLTVGKVKALTLIGHLEGGGIITMDSFSSLDLGGNNLSNGVIVENYAFFGGGTYSGALSVNESATLILGGNVAGTGKITLGNDATLDLGGMTIADTIGIVLDGDATIGNGSMGSFSLKSGKTLALGGGHLTAKTLTLGEGSSLDLNNLAFNGSIAVDGNAATIGNGVFAGDMTVKTLTLSGKLTGPGTITMTDGATLNLGNNTLAKDIALQGGVTIDGGTLGEGGTITGQDGGITKTGAGQLDLNATMDIRRLELQGGTVSVTGREDAKGSIAFIQAEAGTTLTLVHTNANTENATQAYRGNLVIGNGSTVTASGNDGWGFDSANTLTVQTGGRLDLVNRSWTLSADNKIVLAGGEITGWGDSTYGALDFSRGASLVEVTEDSTLSARIRVRGGDSLAFDVAADRQLDFSGGIVAAHELDDDQGTINKTGGGTLVMGGANAMTGGTINVLAGTLETTGDSNPLGGAAVNVKVGATLLLADTPDIATSGTGTVNLEGGNLQITNGNKNFTLNVTGSGSRLAGDADNAFIGTLTLAEGTNLVADGALAGPDGPEQILLKNDSRLELDAGEGKDNWINDITKLQVEGGRATVVNANLRIKEGTEYSLGTGLENLLGEGSSAFCLDNGTLNLNEYTTQLAVSAYRGNDNTVRNGFIATNVDVNNGSGLTLEAVEFVDNVSLTVGDGARLAMRAVHLSDGVSFHMGDKAVLDMGSILTLQQQARLSAFTFTGASARIDNGTLVVDEGQPLTLGADLEGNAVVELADKTVLDLNNHSLANTVTLDGSATIGGGTLNGGVALRGDGSALALNGVALGNNAYFTMSNGARLNLDGNAVDLAKIAFFDNVSTVAVDNGTVTVESGEVRTLGGNLRGTADIDLRGGSLEFANHSWSMTDSDQDDAKVLYTMQANDGHAQDAAIGGMAKADASGFTGTDVAAPAHMQGMKLSTFSNFHIQNTVIGASLIDIGGGTTLYLVDVDIKADTHFTDDPAFLNVERTRAWLEQDVNTFATARGPLDEDVNLHICGPGSMTTILGAGCMGVDLSCNMFDSVTLDGHDLWLDMSSIANSGTLDGVDFFTLSFDNSGIADDVKSALVNAKNLAVTASLDGTNYDTIGFYKIVPDEEFASRLFFLLPEGDEGDPVVPEPSSSSLSLLALCALAARRRRK